MVFVFVLIVLAAVVVPRRYFGFYVACLAMPAAVGAIWPTGTDHSSPFAGTGDAIYALVCIAVALPFAIRAGIIALWPQPSQESASPAAWAALGAVAAASGMALLSLGWADMRPVWMAYIPALAIVAGSLVQLLASRWVANVRFRAYALGVAVSSVVSLAAAGVTIWQRTGEVVDAAEAIAGDNPYCIQVASTRPFGYLARSKLAFSPLTMRTKCREGWCWENHAVLAVDDGGERKLMNWSHRRREFRNDAINLKTNPPLAVLCQPQPHFARELPLLLP